MQIVIPMSGKGQRFMDAGYKEPKPLIMVDGKPMIEHIVNFFPKEHDFVFICNEEHMRTTNMRDVLMRIAPAATIVTIPHEKRGPIHAIMQAANKIADDAETIVSYCDFGMVWDYAAFKKFVAARPCAGVLPYYTGFHPHLLRNQLYAGIRLKADGQVIEIKEKHRFTEHAMDTAHSPGLHYFRSGLLLKKYCEEALRAHPPLHGEYYVPFAYEHMLDDELVVLGYEIAFFGQWGTPEDLKEYLVWSEAFKAGNAEKLRTTKPDGERTYTYWKAFFTQAPWHPYAKSHRV